MCIISAEALFEYLCLFLAIWSTACRSRASHTIKHCSVECRVRIVAHIVACELEAVVPRTLRRVQCAFCWGSEIDDDESGTREADEPEHLKWMISLHRARQARYTHKEHGITGMYLCAMLSSSFTSVAAAYAAPWAKHEEL